MQTIAVIGAGVIGGAMAKSLLKRKGKIIATRR
jgi:predicted dinucleotide-binding enzyme